MMDDKVLWGVTPVDVFWEIRPRDRLRVSGQVTLLVKLGFC